MKGNNFFHKVKPVVALVPQSVGQATVNGAEIKDPWRHGRQLALTAAGGVFGVAVAATLKVQGLKRSDGTTWETLKEPDAATDLQFDPAKLADAAALENGVLLGTLDLDYISATTYKSLRVVYQQTTAAVTALIAVVGHIFDLYDHPSGTVDELFTRQRYG